MSGNSDVSIRPMNINDLKRAMELSYLEGWNQTERDWRLLIENPLNICIVAEQNNLVAGTATGLNHSNEVGWIGMVIVDKTCRGQGVGKMLLTSMIELLSVVRSVKLDATPAGEPLYRKLGFTEERLIYRMTNPSSGNPGKDSSGFESIKIEPESLPAILNLDRELFGADRAYLIRTLFESYPGKAFMIRNNGKPEGYVFGRDGIRFNHIGPLFAFSPDAARSLFIKASESLFNKPVVLDVLDDKTNFTTWLESAGFVKQRYFIRMYLNNNSYPGQAQYQYLIAGPEFG
jgi:ribosomal protein S18 acetylase RimI-like enzyme